VCLVGLFLSFSVCVSNISNQRLLSSIPVLLLAGNFEKSFEKSDKFMLCFAFAEWGHSSNKASKLLLLKAKISGKKISDVVVFRNHESAS